MLGIGLANPWQLGGSLRMTRFELPLASAALAAVVVPSTALADSVSLEFQGTWSRNCADPVAAQFVLEQTAVKVIAGGQRYSYAGVEVSHTWYGGAKATGDRVWLLTARSLTSRSTSLSS